MKQQLRLVMILLAVVLFVACQPSVPQPPAPAATALPPPSPIPPPAHTPTLPPTHTPPLLPTPTSKPTISPKLGPSPILPPESAPSTPPAAVALDWLPPLTLPYTPTGDDGTGRIRGRLFFPSEFVPPLAVYAVATDGSRFYRTDTEGVPPGEPSYEIPGVEPGTYYVYAYPSEGETAYGGAYSYLAACDAGHYPPPPDGCWQNPQYDLVPVEVRAGQAVEQVNIFDWYSQSIPPPPDDVGG